MDKAFNWISILFGTIGGWLVVNLGGQDKWLMALVAFVVLDYITGWIKAWFTKTLSSEVGFRGIIKKIMIFVVVGTAVVLQNLITGELPLRDMVVCFYLSNEGISLLENIAEFIPLPAKLKEVLIQLRNKTAVVTKEE